MSTPVHIRKSHVKRIYRLNDDGTIDRDVWIDVLRIDQITINQRGFRSGMDNLITNQVFKWQDDGKTGGGDVRNENVNKKRKVTNLDVANPELAPTDHSSDILLYIVRTSTIRFPTTPTGADVDAWLQQHVQWVFDNVPEDGSDPGVPPKNPSNRKAKVIRVINNDLGGIPGVGGLDMSNPVSWDDYQTALKKGSKDSTQYVDTEVVQNFSLRYRTGGSDLNNQAIKYVLLNDPVIKLVDAGGAGKNNEGATTIKYRLDPIETIVNVHWTSVSTEVLYYAMQIGFRRPDGSGPGSTDVVYASDLSHPPSNVHFGLTDIIGLWAWRSSTMVWEATDGSGLIYLSPMPAPGSLDGSVTDFRLSIIGGPSGVGPDVPFTPSDPGNVPPNTPEPFSQAPIMEVLQPSSSTSFNIDLSSVALTGTAPGSPTYHCIGANDEVDIPNPFTGTDIFGGTLIFFLFAIH